MSTNKRYAGLIKLLEEWLNEESDHDLKHWGDMRDRSKKIRTAFAPKMNITKKPEIDRILEEAEAHMPKKAPIRQHIAPKCTPLQHGDFISSVNKEAVVSSLWQAIQSTMEGLKTLIGEESSLKLASQRIECCIADWRVENAVD